MKRLQRWVVASVMISSVAVASEQQGPNETQNGQPAPMFRLPVYNAEVIGVTAVGLDRYVGPDPTEAGAKLVLISFMASFCKPCKKELPYLQSLHEKYKSKGLRVMSVSIDGELEGQKLVQQMITQAKITFPVLKDRFQVVSRRWLGAQTPLPSVFLIQPDGTIYAVHRGYNQEVGTLLTKEVEGVLNGVKSKSAAVAQE